MQTFLPYADFASSAHTLDRLRLGKQRVEAAQILAVLEGRSNGWRHHPAVRMWRGFEEALRGYLRAVILAWIERGYRNTIPIPDVAVWRMPPWIGDPDFHAAHQSNLLRKAPEWYSRFGWHVPPNLPYIWPV